MKAQVAIAPDRLGDMFQLQERLMKHYFDTDRLPAEYPLPTLQTQQYQDVIRDYLGYVDEEMSEMYEEYKKVNAASKENTEHFTKEDWEDLQKKVLSVHEEASDITHFLIEIMIFLNIDDLTYRSYIEKVSIRPGLDKIDGLTASYQSVEHLSGPELANALGIPFYSMGDISIKVSDARLKFFEEAWLSCHHAMMKVRMFMKAKPWRVKPDNPDIQSIQGNICEAFSLWFVMLQAIGIDAEPLHQMYKYKNNKNFERITQGW